MKGSHQDVIQHERWEQEGSLEIPLLMAYPTLLRVKGGQTAQRSALGE